MVSPPSQVRADFDRIAEMRGDRPSPVTYSRWILARAPARAAAALDIGCGSGDLCAALAPRAERIIGIDLSRRMIESAQRRCSSLPNVEFRTGDVIEMELPPTGFDLVVSAATLHHVPLRAVLSRIERWLRPGGRLLVVDLRRPVGWIDPALARAGSEWGWLWAHLRGGRRGRPASEWRLWREHVERDEYCSVPEVRAVCADLLPGAVVRWRLLWRYTLEWDKPR